jgi:asparagine synthase (glutamine-hydrolysing)
MSGIAGIVRFDGAPFEPGLIEAMTAAMAHRGPDGIRHWRKGSVALGLCMLRTTPESLEETQPLANEDESLVLVMDGRLDNWVELRAELLARGSVLRTRSDAELVLRAYETWGRECLGHLDGDFALAIWDARRQALFCARDRLGTRPFNYRQEGATLAFASELHALLALPGVPATLNEDLRAEYLANDWRSAEATPWRGIHRLAAAHCLEAAGGGLRARRYWLPDFRAQIAYPRDEDYVEHYRTLLQEAVRRSARTQSPLACEVSGGLDSSAVFAFAADLLRRGALPAPSLAGFTLRFENDPPADELAYARAVAAHVGLPVHEVDASRQPLAWYRDWARKYREFPGYPNGVMGWGIRAAAQAQGSRVLLVGTGGDEWLAGSRDYYAEEFAAGRWGDLAACLRADLLDAGAALTLRWLARSCAVALLPQSWLPARLARRPDEPAFGRAGQAALYRTLEQPYDAIAWDAEERLAASLGLELRRPLSTVAMVQFAFSTPERLRVRGTTEKWLHRHALAGRLPPRVLERRDKADFMGSFRVYRDELRRLADAAAPDGWLSGGERQALLARFGNPAERGIPEWRLWSWLGWRMLAAAGGNDDVFRQLLERGPARAVQ